MDEVIGRMAVHQVRLEPLGVSFQAGAEQTLLVSARSSGIALPSSCRNGTCRTCLCRVTSGRVGYRIEWPGVSVEEKRDGFILPCVAYPLTSLVLEVPGAGFFNAQT